MRKGCFFVLHLLRHLFVSQETLIYVASFVLYISWVGVRDIFSRATSETDYILWVLGILLALCVYVCYAVKDVLWPEEENRLVLIEWNGYLQLQACCVAAIIHACAPIMLTVILILLPDLVTNCLRAYLLLVFLLVLAFDALACLLAPISLSQILTKEQQIKGNA